MMSGRACGHSPGSENVQRRPPAEISNGPIANFTVGFQNRTCEPRAGASEWIVIHSRPMRGIDQMSQPGHAERARTAHGIVPAELRGRVYWGTPHSAPQRWFWAVSLCHDIVQS